MRWVGRLLKDCLIQDNYDLLTDTYYQLAHVRPSLCLFGLREGQGRAPFQFRACFAFSRDSQEQ